jgi:hypothetical protein
MALQSAEQLKVQIKKLETEIERCKSTEKYFIKVSNRSNKFKDDVADRTLLLDSFHRRPEINRIVQSGQNSFGLSIKKSTPRTPSVFRSPAATPTPGTSHPTPSVELEGYREDVQLSSSESSDSDDSDEEKDEVSEEKGQDSEAQAAENGEDNMKFEE